MTDGLPIRLASDIINYVCVWQRSLYMIYLSRFPYDGQLATKTGLRTNGRAAGHSDFVASVAIRRLIDREREELVGQTDRH